MQKLRSCPRRYPHRAERAGRAPISRRPGSRRTPYFAANCANCHGTDGRAVSAIPPLAGRDRAYLEETMKAFKTGARPATIMHQLAKGYTDEEIAVLAEYFAKQK
jgi:sulfide dehydrogenase cytochrome subunit